VKCEEHGVLQVAVPWARSGSSLTLLFEALSLTLIREMPVSAAARILGEDDEKLWRVAEHYVEEALSDADYSDVS
jgi:transposase